MTDAKEEGGDVAIPVKVAKAPKPAPPSTDYAAEIVQKLAREPGDRVTCVRVFDDFYRCNWWTPSAGPADARAIPWLAGSVRRVRKSQFVRATFTQGRLVIEDVTREPIN